MFGSLSDSAYIRVFDRSHEPRLGVSDIEPAFLSPSLDSDHARGILEALNRDEVVKLRYNYEG